MPLDSSRQRDLANPEIMAQKNVLVVGCGAIGSNICKQLALLGVNSITVVDDDVIEEHNVQPQMWPLDTVGKSKVGAIKDICNALNPDVEIIDYRVKWSPKCGSNFDAVFPSVDSIDTRKFIYKYYKQSKDRCEAFIDVRIGATLGLVLSVLGDDKGWYEKTIFDKSEAYRNGCVQPMINPVANVASGLAVMNFVNHMCDQGVVPRISQYIGTCGIVMTPSVEEVFSE